MYHTHPKYKWKGKRWDEEGGGQTSRDVSDSSFPNKNRAECVSRYFWRGKAAAITQIDLRFDRIPCIAFCAATYLSLSNLKVCGSVDPLRWEVDAAHSTLALNDKTITVQEERTTYFSSTYRVGHLVGKLG